MVRETNKMGAASGRSPQVPPSIPSGLVDARAVAEYLGVAVSTVHRLAARGVLPRVELGARLVRFRLSDIEAFVATRTRGEAGAPTRGERLLGGGRARAPKRASKHAGKSPRRTPSRAPREDLAITAHPSVHGKQESPGG